MPFLVHEQQILKNRQKSGNKAKCKRKKPKGVERTALRNDYVNLKIPPPKVLKRSFWKSFDKIQN